VNSNAEFVLPSNRPVNILRQDCALIVTPSGEQELFHLIFSRDPLMELFNSASEATGDISHQLLDKLKRESGQILKRQKGSTPVSEVLVNINAKDNEEIIETREVKKRN